MKSRGFTLLEILVALAITSIIGGILGSSLYTAFKARRSVEAALMESRGQNILSERITEDLVNALPPTGVFAGQFAGVTDSISFYASGGDSHAAVPGDIHQVEYYISTEPELKGTLVRRVTTNLTPGDGVETPPEEPICKNVTSFAVNYFDGSYWLDQWDSTTHQDANGIDTLPMSVKVTIDIETPGRDPEHIEITVSPPCALPLAPMTGGL